MGLPMVSNLMNRGRNSAAPQSAATAAGASPTGSTPAQPASGWNPAATAGNPMAEMAQMRGDTPAQNTAAPTASPWATPGANLQSYGPGNDLRGTSILPTDSTRTQAASAQADGAYGTYAGYQPPTWNALPTYSSQNSMSGIPQLSTSPVAGPNFGAAQSAMNGALPRASQYGADAAAGMGGIGAVPGVSFDGSRASAGFDAGAAATGGAFSYDGSTNAARDMTLQRLSQMQTPDRQALALQMNKAMEDESAPAYEQAQRAIGQKAAALGRIGSGVTTNELGDAFLARERSLGNQRSMLAADAAGKALQDGIDYTGAANGVFNSFAGADQGAKGLDLQRASVLNSAAQGQLGVAQGETSAQAANASNALQGQNLQLQRSSLLRDMGNDEWQRGMDRAGMESGWARDQYGANVANEDRRLDVQRTNNQQTADGIRFAEDRDRYGYQSGVNERDSGFNAGIQRGTFLGQQASTLGAREDQLRGVDAGNRNELRTERGFQNSQAQQAQRDRIEMAQFNEWLQGQNINNATQLYGGGQTGNPGAVYGQQAANAQAQANGAYDALGQTMQYLPYAYNNRSNATSSPAYRTASGPTYA